MVVSEAMSMPVIRAGRSIGMVIVGCGGRCADDGDAGLDGAAAVLREQLGDPVGRGLADGRVDAALVALAGLGGELVATAGAEHRHGVPVGGLDQHAGGGVGHLGVLAAHHAAEADDAGVVGDDEVLGRERAVVAVEGGEVLPRGGAADADRAGELVGVVAVDRAAELEHHVVGDVDGQRDRALAEQHQASGHPVGCRRGRVEAGDRAGHEDRAALGVVDHDRVAVAVVRRGLAEGRVAEGGAVRQGRLAGDTAQRHARRRGRG